MVGNSKRGALSIAKSEIRKQKLMVFFESFFLILALISASSTLVLLSNEFLFTGNAISPLQSQAGSVTEMNVTRKFPTTYWGGVYGLALRVSGFTEQFSKTMDDSLERQDLFFNCIQLGVMGGNEVYASISPTVDFDSLQPANLNLIDEFTGCSGKVDCASNTFTQSMSLIVGTRNITNVPSTYTKKWDGTNEVFDLGALVDSSGNLVYVTHLSSLQKGYSPNVTVNFQMILPVQPGSNQYYFFADPYDDCPAGGGVGDTLTMSLSGYVKDVSGNVVENASVVVAGYTSVTDDSGYYLINATLVVGEYNLFAFKDGYDDYYSNITLNFTDYILTKNITLQYETPGSAEFIDVIILGKVVDSSGNPVSSVNISSGGSNAQSNLDGDFSFNATNTRGLHTIVALKESYDNYYDFINYSYDNEIIYKNITLNEIIIQEELFIGEYDQPPQEIPPERKQGEDYWISTKEIIKEVRQNTFIEEKINIYSYEDVLSLTFSLDSELQEIIELNTPSLILNPETFGDLTLTIKGIKPVGIYHGNLTISGSMEKQIPITIKIIEKKVPIETLLMQVDLFDDKVSPGDVLKYKLSVQNLLRGQEYQIFFKDSVMNSDGNKVYSYTESKEEISNLLTLLKEIPIPENLSNGNYILNIDASYLDITSGISVPFVVSQPLYMYAFLGIPLWIFLVIISFLSFVSLNVFVYKRHLDKKKRYKIELDSSTLPHLGSHSLRLGKIAEKNIPAYLEYDKLTTHSIIAGATGMGKSISAQVLIEEALMKNIAVIVFDPTAQWSGMLRKCEDKKMISYYPRFGLKPSDARGFPGNIRAIKNARQIIDVNKFINPGQIQIFTLNKLDPKDIDLFIANMIRQIFRSDPKESPNLKVLLVFDEVHRLLSKFGGSGEGFIQIERGCREFRKWGIGLVLISQVLNDFVGEIKANINTEVQTRTVEETDLARIQMKYGDKFLKSLVKAEVGVALFQNADYNRGRPYFIQFRPILHNTRRLSDEELDKYNKYNEIVDDLEYQIEQLETEKVDIFDLKMELKLVKDKIMTGNFSVVDIYLEGLQPRVQKEWDKLGKKPKKKEIELADVSEIKKSVEEAKKQREKIVEKEEKEMKEKQNETEIQNIDEKQFQPLTFDNGLMVSSLKELKQVLPNLDNEIFRIHVNKNKNDISKWLSQISESQAKSVEKIISKSELIKSLENFGKPPVKTVVKKTEEKVNKK